MSFTIRGVKLRIDFSFLLFASMLFLLRDSRSAFCFITVCFVHEAGHAAALCLVGGRLHEIIFLGMGIKMIPEQYGFFSVKKDLIVLLAGPAVNLLVFVFLNMISPGNLFALLNLCAAVFNLLPYSSLDGGAALDLIFENKTCAPFVLMPIRSLPLIFTVYGLLRFGNIFFVPLCVVIFYFLCEFK